MAVKVNGQETGGTKIKGTSGKDIIEGLDVQPYNDPNVLVYGRDGDDTIKFYWGNNTISGGDGNDEISIINDGKNRIYGGNGNDIIYLNGNGNDTITGGRGDDYICDGGGNDAYIFSVGDGQDTIYDWSGMDKIFLNNISKNDVKFRKSIDTDDLIIEYNPKNGNYRDSIDINYWYYSSDYKIESIVFKDGTYTKDQIEALSAIEGTDGDDYICSWDGNDTYRFNVGSGNDTICDDSGTDKIVLSGISKNNVKFTKNSDSYNNLIIEYNLQNGHYQDSIVVIPNWSLSYEDSFYYHDVPDGKIESIVFKDGNIP